METFHIRKLSGIETKFSATDQDRGTLRRADGIVCVPADAVSTGPRWDIAWPIPPTFNVNSWVIETASEINIWNCAVWAGGTINKYVAVGSNGTNNVMTSPDGITWTSRVSTGRLNSVCWSEDLSLLVAVGDTGVVSTSTDGINWTAQTGGGGIAVVWASGLSLFVSVSNGGGVKTSPDGVIWTARTAAAASGWRCIAWSEGLSLLVAGASSGTNRLMTSPDGITWTSIVGGFSSSRQYFGICWASGLNKFVSVGDSTTSCVVSTDGVTWTVGGNPGLPLGRSVIWVDDLGLLVAVGSLGGNRISVSFDGATWALQTQPAVKSWVSVTWSPNTTALIAVASGGADTAAVMLSYNPYTQSLFLDLVQAARTLASVTTVGFFTVTHPSGVTPYFLGLFDNVSGLMQLWSLTSADSTPQVDPTTAMTFTVTALASALATGKTAQTPWYGTWIGRRLFLGNGVDANLVWQNGALALLGPQTTPNDPDNPARVPFPPSITFAIDRRGVIWSSGYASHPLRVYHSELPTLKYPELDGIRSLTWSYKDVLAPSGGTVTALSIMGGILAAHLSNGGPVALYDAAPPVDKPADLNASAINPNCVQDGRTHRFFLGTDLEVYRQNKPDPVDDSSQWRDKQIVTDRSSGDWNQHLGKPYASVLALGSFENYFTVYDEQNGRLWFWVHLKSPTLGSPASTAIYCYDERSFAITGPFFAPYFVAIAKLDTGGDRMLVVGLTNSGQMLYADLAQLGEKARISASDPTGADYGERAAVPVMAPGFSYVAMNDDYTKFEVVFGTAHYYLNSPWGEWLYSGSSQITPTRYFKNARIAMFEIADEDFGEPVLNKEFCNARLQWGLNDTVPVFAGVFIDCEGKTSGKWRRSCFPKAEQICGLKVLGRRGKIRVIIVAFNDKPALLTGLSVDYELTGAS